MRNHKNLSLLGLVVMLMALLVSCGGKKDQKDIKTLEQDFIRPAEMTLDKNDTAEVKSLVNNYLAKLKAKDFNGAVNMLYLLKNDSVTIAPKKYRDRQLFTMKAFQGVRYELESMSFLKETDCRVKYNSILFDKKKGDKHSNVIGFALRPVRYQGKWYLTIDDTENKDAAPSEIPE